MSALIHHISASMISGPIDTDDFERVHTLARRLEQYARRLGFDVLYESADEAWEAPR